MRQIGTVSGTALVAKCYVQAPVIEPVIGALLHICCAIEEASVALDLHGRQARAMAEYHSCTWIDLVYRHRTSPPVHALPGGRA